MSTHEGSHRDWQNVDDVNDWVVFDRAREEERVLRLQTLVGLIPFSRGEAIRVLDVGAGYGLLSQQVLEAFPKAQVTFHDYSERMFALARERLNAYAPRVSWVEGDLSSPDWTKGLSGPFEAVVSSIAIHNVHSPERIRSIYAELFPLVKKGGCFLNIEHIGPAGEVSSRLYRQARREERQRHLKESSGTEESPEYQREHGRQTQAEQGHWRGHGGAPLESHLTWLHEAGFDEVDCFWKDMGRAIIGGYRSTE